MKRVVLLASLIALVAGACGSLGAQAVTLSLAYKAGDTYRYTLHVVLKYTVGGQGLSLPLNVEMTGKETLKVNAVDSSGTADLTVAMSDTSVKTTVNGTTSTTTSNTTTTIEVKVTKDGRVVSVNGNAFGNSGGLPGMTGGEGGLVSAILPDQPVKKGDTWKKTYDQTNPMHSSGSVHVTTDNTYLKDDTVGKVNAAVVDSKISSDLDLSFDLSALSGQSGTSLFPTGGSMGMKSMALKGTTKSDVMTWIDIGARHIVKSKSSGSLDATITLNLDQSAGTTTTPMPILSGPITFKGTQTLEMNPA